ncbi:MAG: ribonuclease R [Pseudobdellovibrio sp.]
MNSKQKTLNGLVKRHPDGFGFFIPEDKEHPDVYIPSNGMNSAMTNDRVSIYVERERDGRFRGEIFQINERSQKTIAGKFTVINDRYGIIKDDGKGWGTDLKITLDKSMNAKDGELVAAKITKYPDNGKFEGEVIEVIGDALNALNDIKRVCITQNITTKFSEANLEEAKQFSNNPTEKDFAKRIDLRHLPIITIDGATAKDFDDAVYVEMTNTGFHLYVAIADVSHYVKVASAMDKDAYERGTSVYFPNFVVPMLPEALSNGLCSLNPHVPRLALVAEMNFDFTGEMTSSHFFEGVIESKSRVTYGEAQELIDGNPSDKTQSTKLPEVQENIYRCADLAKVLMAKRFKEGSLDLEVPETELVIDGTGEPIDIIKSERLFAHRLIEELMLAANVAVAKFLSSKEIPSFYRVHEEPAAEKISLLQRYMTNLGSTAKEGLIGGGKLQKRLTRMLHEFDGKPEAQIIHILTLRSMSQAKYTKNNLGHFGLGFEFYTHFTSPIRRYPDLIVHRLLKSQIMPGSQYRLISDDDLGTAGTWLSACEQKSAKAERQIQAIKKARFMKKMEGQGFEGIVSSVTKFGVFVLLREFNIDGLIRLDDLGLDKWEFDEENLTLTAKRSGLTYSMGDNLHVIVSSVDIEQGQINFLIDKDNPTNQHRIITPSKKSGKSDHKESYKSKSDKKDFKPGGDRSRDKSKKFKDKKGAPSDKTSRPVDRDANKKKSGYTSERPALKYMKKNASADFSSSTVVRKPTPTATTTTTPAQANSSYEIKPRYSSLADYLDQKRTTQNEDSSSKPTKKSTSGAASNRQDSEKRWPSKNNSDGVRKARPKNSSRKNKSR